MNNLTILPAILLCIFFLSSCRSSNKLYIQDPEYNTELRSACREGRITPLLNESTISAFQRKTSDEAIKSIKLRTTTDPGKASYKTDEMRMNISEKCDLDGKGSTSVRISHLMKLRNTGTGEVVELMSDTMLVPHHSLTSTGKAAITEAEIQANMKSLIERNLKKAKDRLQRK